MSAPEKPVTLPPKYYLDNFLYLLEFVEKYYAGLLSEEEKKFIEIFRLLPEDGQCIYVRMANRKGLFFRVDRFDYPEIEAFEDGLASLVTNQLVGFPDPESLGGKFELLQCFTKPELLRAFKDNPELKALKKLRKAELILVLAEAFSAEELVGRLCAQERVFQQKGILPLEMLRFLFAGHLGFNMSEFVIRDLGNAKYEEHKGDFTPNFHTRKEAEDKFLVSIIYQEFKWNRDLLPPDDVFVWFQNQKLTPSSLSESAIPMLDRMVGKIGRWLEQQSLPSEAEEVYRLSQKPPARERRVRLLQKLGQQDEALQLCQEIAEAPFNAEEQFFAQDFIQKSEEKSTKKSTTQLLQKSPQISVPFEDSERVETSVLEYYSREGKGGFFSENFLWRDWFGLLCWDLVFNGGQEVVHHPLQRAPSDLYGPQFFESREEGLAERMLLLSDREAMLKAVEATFAEKEGTLNPFVGWHHQCLEQIQIASGFLPPEGVGKVFMQMAKNLKDNSRGFPDLLIFDEESYQFVEVKSPNDHLSPQQLFWLQFFPKVGINACINRVKWLGK